MIIYYKDMPREESDKLVKQQAKNLFRISPAAWKAFINQKIIQEEEAFTRWLKRIEDEKKETP